MEPNRLQLFAAHMSRIAPLLTGIPPGHFPKEGGGEGWRAHVDASQSKRRLQQMRKSLHSEPLPFEVLFDVHVSCANLPIPVFCLANEP